MDIVKDHAIIVRVLPLVDCIYVILEIRGINRNRLNRGIIVLPSPHTCAQNELVVNTFHITNKLV